MTVRKNLSENSVRLDRHNSVRSADSNKASETEERASDEIGSYSCDNKARGSWLEETI